MQGSQLIELLKVGDHGISEAHRLAEALAPMDDTMADCLDRRHIELLEDPSRGIIVPMDVTFHRRVAGNVQAGTASDADDEAGKDSAECWVLSAEI